MDFSYLYIMLIISVLCLEANHIHLYLCRNSGSGGTTEVVFERINFANAIVKSSLERYEIAIESFEGEPHIVRCTPLPSRGSEPL